MFHRYGKKGRLTTKPIKELIKILPVETFLSEDKRQGLLQEIKAVCALEEARFDSLCLTLIYNLINHCQNLPETMNSYYSQPGGLLDFALNRTEAALNLFKNYLILNDKVSYSEEQKLWQYALLSAALLQGIGKLYADLKVNLFDASGQLLKEWNPLLENLTLLGSHYNYEFKKESDPDFKRRLNLILAKNLMPTSGFAWISSNPQVLAVWLALLHEDFYSAGTLGAILIRSRAIALQRYFNELMIKNHGHRNNRYNRVSTFSGGTPELISAEQQVAVDFIQWLNRNLADGVIMINKAPLLMVPGGMLMCPEIFKYFIREHPDYKSWQAVQNALLSLNMHRLNDEGDVNFRFEQSNNQQMHSGIILSDYAVVLPDEVNLYNMHTGESTRLAATELIHQAQYNHYLTEKTQHAKTTNLLHLDTTGQWQTIKNLEPTLSANNTPGVTSSV